MTVQASSVDAPSIAEAPLWTRYSVGRRWIFIAVLFLISLCNYADRHLMSVLVEPIKAEFGASDTVMGALTGFAFALFYAVLGLPIARWADRGDRVFIISASLALWSIASACCGLARTIPQLALARMGVGVGEAGAGPASTALLADYFPPEKRGQAVAMVVLSATFGILLAYVVGAMLAQSHGWRTAFLVVSLPGVPLAVLSWFVLDEPRRRARKAAAAQHKAESTLTAVKALFKKRSLVYATIGMSLYMMVVSGVFLWLPAYMQRVLHADLATAGAVYGLSSIIGPLVGTLMGGVLIDRLARKDPRWLSWLPAIGILVCLPLYVAMVAYDYMVLLVAGAVSGTILSVVIPATMAFQLAVSGANRRSLSIAASGFLQNLIGMGLGPVLAGAASDFLTARYGEIGLRYALIAMILLFLPASFCFFRAAKFVAKDIAEEPQES